MAIIDNDRHGLAHDREVRLQTENKVLLNMAKSIASIRDKVDLLKVILDSVLPLFDADDVGLGVLNQEADTLTDWAVVFPEMTNSAVNMVLNTNQDTTMSLTNSLIEKTIRDVENAGHPLLIDLTESLAQQWPEATYLPVELANGFKQCLFTTLKVGNKLIGAFNLNGRHDNHFQRYDIVLFQAIADLLAVAVANILANEELARKAKEKNLQLSTLKLINQLPSISSHEKQVATLLQVAQEMDRVMPFDMLVSNTFFNNLHFLSSCFEISKQAGVFRPLPERESFRNRQSFQLHQLTESQLPMSDLFRHPGVYVGQAFDKICTRYANCIFRLKVGHSIRR